jgi:F420-non-reducing hydrogenase small subunit
MKLKLAIGLGSTCSGCDIAILDLAERLLDLVELADIVFWPTAMDFKLEDLSKFREGEIDISLYHGTVRTSEQEHIAHVLREKSKAIMAFGSCACFGGIPGLCNLTNREEIFRTAYRDTPSTVNPDFIIPQTEVKIGEFTLTLPELYNDGRSLPQVVNVDYFLPGCPPAVELIEKLIPILRSAQNGELPPKGRVIASDKILCDECPLTREEKIISQIARVHEVLPDPGRCLLEQGVLCMGPATRGGCGAKCINAFMPCRGCMGPPPGVKDQGARMIAAIASILAVNEEQELPEEEVERLIDEIEDPAGTFYRFTLPEALLNRKVGEGR